MMMRTRSRGLRSALMLGLTPLLLMFGCAVTETGNPPVRPEFEGPIESVGDPFGVGVDQVPFTISGDGGSAPPGGEVIIARTESAEPWVRVPVATDGSFNSPMFDVGTTEVVRLFLQVDGIRSLPLDFVPDPETFTRLIPYPTTECVVVPLDVNLAATGEIAIENRCDGVVEIVPDGSVTPLDTALVEAGGTARFDVSADVDQLVSIELRGAVMERRWITVFVP